MMIALRVLIFGYLVVGTPQTMNAGCLLHPISSLSFEPQRWWTCKKHVGECFDELTIRLRGLLTLGKCRGHACYSKEGVKHLQQQIQVIGSDPAEDERLCAATVQCGHGADGKCTAAEGRRVFVGCAGV